MTGRVGLVDTAVKTAETGYMQRRLMKGLEDLTIAYDGSVRSSAGSIVQFRFGEDGLDPMEMESSVLGRPVDFARLLHIAQMSIICADEPPLSYSSICQRVDVFLQANSEFSSKFCEETRVAVKEVFTADVITMSQLNFVLETAQKKYTKSLCDPGTAVGAICGQSIGEPGTQMTLKTFHFAGLASMALVLGVPRIKEIINAAKTIATPFISAPLVNQSSENAARIVKRRLEKTTLGQVANYIKEVYCESQVYLSIKIDLDLIMRLGLIINAKSIRDSILSTPRTKLKEPNVILVNPHRLHITVPGTMKGKLLQNLQQLRKQLPRVLVSGTETVNRVIISSEKAATGNIYKLSVARYSCHCFVCVYFCLQIRGRARTAGGHVNQRCERHRCNQQ
jgi:DNA-directed RNA polymerase III subunit RPC1